MLFKRISDANESALKRKVPNISAETHQAMEVAHHLTLN